MSSFTKKFSLAAVAAATSVTLAAPVANADPVSDALDRIPPGQISCEQARAYWTNEAEYQSLRSQAQAVAPFHPRGAELRDAVARIDEAANRCGLRGTTSKPSQHTNTPAPAQNGGGNGGGGNTAPAQNGGGNGGGGNAAPAPAANVINLGVQGNTPYVDVPVAGVATLRVPDVMTILKQAMNQFNIPNMSSF